MTHLVVPNRLWNIHRLVTRFLQSEGKIQVFGTERTEERIEPVQLLEDIRPYHHRAATGNTGFGRIILTFVQFAKPNRLHTPEYKTDLSAASIIDQAAVMHKAQLRLGLS